jgi:hypothetical protein
MIDHPDRRRLAGAVGSEKSEDLPAPRLERDIVDGVNVRELFMQMFGLYHDSSSNLLALDENRFGLLTKRARGPDMNALAGILEIST